MYPKDQFLIQSYTFFYMNDLLYKINDLLHNLDPDDRAFVNVNAAKNKNIQQKKDKQHGYWILALDTFVVN